MADDSHYSGGDSATAKRKYDGCTTAPPPSAPRRASLFSAAPTDSTPSYNNVHPPMDEISLVKQKAQEIATRIFNLSESKCPKFDNGGSGWDNNDSKDYGNTKNDLSSATPSIPPSYGYGNPSKRIEVPNGRVGVIIGKAGETIKYLQLQSGAKIQVTRDRRCLI